MSIETTEPQEIIITETEQINLAVAAIAGWTNIKPWNDNLKSTIAKRTFIGTNEVHPELGIFIPNYVESLDAISKVFQYCNFYWQLSVSYDKYGFSSARYLAPNAPPSQKSNTPTDMNCLLRS